MLPEIDLSFYVQPGRITAAAGMNRDVNMLYITELLGKNQLPAALHEGMNWAASYNELRYSYLLSRYWVIQRVYFVYKAEAALV